jgi:hypothetical protein
MKNVFSKSLPLLSIAALLLFLLNACEKPLDPTEIREETTAKVLPSQPGLEKSKIVPNETKKCTPSYSNLRVLFIGNSYTDNFTNDIPQMFEDLAIHNNISIGQISSSAVNGFTLQNHANHAPTVNLINQGNWDFVILQPNSGLLFSGNQSTFISGLNSLKSLIDQSSPNADILLYQVVPPTAYSASNNSAYQQALTTFNQLFYGQANQHNNMFVVNVSWAFTQAYQGAFGYVDNPQIPLRLNAQAGYHYWNPGGFLTAVCFYSAVFRNKPCIPNNMTFVNSQGNQVSGPVATFVPSYDILAQIGYVTSYTAAVTFVPKECRFSLGLGQYPAHCP